VQHLEVVVSGITATWRSDNNLKGGSSCWLWPILYYVGKTIVLTLTVLHLLIVPHNKYMSDWLICGVCLSSWFAAARCSSDIAKKLKSLHFNSQRLE